MNKNSILALCAVAAAMVYPVRADFTRVEWIQSTGGQWINTLYRPACTDKVEMKVLLTDLSATQCLFCSRGNNYAENTYTCFLIGGALRFDRYDDTNTSISDKPKANVEYIVTADGASLKAKYATTGGAVIDTMTMTMKRGDFTPGSYFTLFASHTAGTSLNESTEIGNYGKFRLYYFKVFDKDGKLKCDLVPVRDNDASDGDYQRYGLFDTVGKKYLPNNRAPSAFSAGGANESEKYEEVKVEVGEVVIDVAEGATRTLTIEEVAAFGNQTLVKKGRGTLIAGEKMKDFNGDIRILEGFYDATVSNAFGTANGVTYVDGGTIISRVGATHEWNGDPSYASESFFLNGTGCDSNGVIRCETKTLNFAGRGAITLTGDILVTGKSNLEFRYGTVNMKSHDIYVAMDKYVSFRLVATSLRNGGNVIVLSGQTGIEGAIDGASPDKSFTMKPGTMFTVNTLEKIQHRTLNFENTAIMQFSASKAALGSIGDYGHLDGPVNLLGEGAPLSLKFNNPGHVLNLSGPISGSRGIYGYNGGWLQLGNADNTMTGALGFNGILTKDGLSTTGGVSMVGAANLPREGGGIVLTNAQFHSYLDNDASNTCMVTSHSYPALSIHGVGVITSSTCNAAINLKSLKKTGNGALSVFGRVHVDGDTAIEQGALSFKTAVPAVPAGLNWYYKYITGVVAGQLPSDPTAYHGVDPAGVRFAYRSWMPTVDKDGIDAHKQAHWYSGYIRVPGEEGTKVVCNFVSSVTRYCYVKIGNKEVVHMSDSTDKLSGTTFPNWDRLYVGPQVELDAGWQPIYIVLHNWWGAGGGPAKYDKYNWPENFGVGVDWKGRCETNSVNYAKFLDPGDGSFLRPTLSDRAELDAKLYRPSFGGAVSFAPGTVFEINDTAPYIPVEIPALAGVPVVRNGAVAVQSLTWTLRGSDLMDANGEARNAPLTLDETSVLTFPEGDVTLDIVAGDLAALETSRRSRTFTLISAPAGKMPANNFVLPSQLRGKGLWVRKSDTALRLVYSPGTILFLR